MFRKVVVALALATTASPSMTTAQGLRGGGGADDGRIEGRFKFLPLPYVNYNRSFGFTIGALPMVMVNPVKKDTISPSSVGGLLGMYASNGTWFVLGFGRVFLDEDRWRVTAAGGGGNVNFQFYLDNPINLWIPYNTWANFAYAEVQRRIVGKLFGGVSYLYMHFRNTTEFFPNPVTTTLNGAGLKLTMDTRPNVYYPRGGFFTNLAYFTYPSWLGNTVESNTVDLDLNKYWSARKDSDVIAGRAFVGLGIGDLSFNQQYIIGRRDIRGYTQGAHRGNYLLALQGEYRWNPWMQKETLWRRFGFVGFAGVATVYEAINSADNGRLFPGVGAGVRFTAFTDNHMNIGLDAAVGDGDWGIYFRIGEAF